MQSKVKVSVPLIATCHNASSLCATKQLRQSFRRLQLTGITAAGFTETAETDAAAGQERHKVHYGRLGNSYYTRDVTPKYEALLESRSHDSDAGLIRCVLLRSLGLSILQAGNLDDIMTSCRPRDLGTHPLHSSVTLSQVPQVCQTSSST